MQYPTLLRMPPWLGFPEERVLPHPPQAYRVQQEQTDWFRVLGPSGEEVYTGIGPVEVVASPAPF